MIRPVCTLLVALSAGACVQPQPEPDASVPVDAGPVLDAGLTDDGGPGLVRVSNPSCVAPAPPPDTSGVKVVRAFPGLRFAQPLGLFQAPNDSSTLFVMEREGRIQAAPSRADAGMSEVRLVVDLSSKVDAQGEGGLLGMAFHPQWPTRAELYVSYTERSAPLRSVIARLRSSDGGKTFDASTEERLLTLEQPFANHNGGHLAFGPDGFLYIGFGDGGSGGDPLGAGQRLNTNLGKLLRIDVNVPAEQRYAIPPTNPFASAGAPCNLNTSHNSADAGTQCAEVYALGFRNPWRFSFDTVSNELWVGDVGQGQYEEVDRVELGGNYGWSVREGRHCYGRASCSTAGLVDPVVEYDHALGNSITGGYVYWGQAAPQLRGKLVYGDYGSGRVWALESDGQGGARGVLLTDTNLALASFAQLSDGEVYALDIATGFIWGFEPDGSAAPDTFPKRLSQTGCVEPTNPSRAVPAMVPYALNAPFWSDGADKERHFALPDDAGIVLTDGGDFDFPPGTVLMKTFTVEGRRVETRLFMRHLDGDWAGYSYEWRDDGSDADLLQGAKVKPIGSRQWVFPSRAQCLQCHTAIAGRSLGLELGQLDSELTYPATQRRRPQLETLALAGFFSSPLPSQRVPLPNPFGTAPLESRARAYLHANCAPCHQQGFGQGVADFRFSRTLAETGVCEVAPSNGDLGLTDARVLAPGAPARSVLSRRMHALDVSRMPPVGSLLVDEAGTALVDAWIMSVSSCPP